MGVKIVLNDCEEKKRSFDILRAVREIEGENPGAKCTRVYKLSEERREIQFSDGTCRLLVFEGASCFAAQSDEEWEKWKASVPARGSQCVAERVPVPEKAGVCVTLKRLLGLFVKRKRR